MGETSRPLHLQAGDRVAVVAPSGPLDPDRLGVGVRLLESWGLRVEVGEHALDRAGYLAGSDRDRASDLGRAWTDDGIRAIFCARGGFGAGRLVELLPWDRMRRSEPPVLVGSSDVTVLHDAVAVRLGAATLFGPMIASELVAGAAPGDVSVDRLRASLFEPESACVLEASDVLPVSPGLATGRTAGGTLTLVASALGTPDQRVLDGTLLLLEDVNESPYRVDRLLTQLLRSGALDRVAGFVLGSWEGCGDVLPVLAERLLPLGVPIAAGFAFGHGSPQLTVPLGVPATLDAGAGVLRFAEPALR